MKNKYIKIVEIILFLNIMISLLLPNNLIIVFLSSYVCAFSFFLYFIYSRKHGLIKQKFKMIALIMNLYWLLCMLNLDKMIYERQDKWYIVLLILGSLLSIYIINASKES